MIYNDGEVSHLLKDTHTVLRMQKKKRDHQVSVAALLCLLKRKIPVLFTRFFSTTSTKMERTGRGNIHSRDTSSATITPLVMAGRMAHAKPHIQNRSWL